MAGPIPPFVAWPDPAMFKPRLFFSLGYWRIDRSDPRSAFKLLNRMERKRLDLAYAHLNKLNASVEAVELRMAYYDELTRLKRNKGINNDPPAP